MLFINKSTYFKALSCEISLFLDKLTGKHYCSSYSNGLTEQQDESPYEYANDEEECGEVEQVEVLVKQWKPIS